MHLKRVTIPKTWPVKRKQNKWIARPMPGPHPLKDSLTLSVLMKELLGYSKIKKETRKILNEGKILINKVKRKEYRFPIGLMDIIEVPSLKENYIILYNKIGNFSVFKTKNNNEKLCRIIGKTNLKKGKLQLNLNDGRNILIAKDTYKIGDSVIIELKDNKIKSHLKFEKGTSVYLTQGSYKGLIGNIIEIKEGTINKKPKIIFEVGKEKYETLKDYAFVIGDTKNLGIEQ